MSDSGHSPGLNQVKVIYCIYTYTPSIMAICLQGSRF